MSSKRILLTSLRLLAVAAAITIAGCGGSNNSNNGNASMRIVNAFSQATALDVAVNNNTIVSALPFQGVTQYKDVDSGTQTFAVTVTGATTALINTSNSTNSNSKYSYIIYGPKTAAGAVLVSDDYSSPPDGYFSLRFINVAAGPGPLDVYLTAPGADITSSAPSVTTVNYSLASAYVNVGIGKLFEVRVTPSGTKDVVYDSTVSQTFAEHSATDIIAFSKGSGKLVNIAVMNHDDAGTGKIVESNIAQYKVANASLASSSLNIFVDGNLQLSNIPYTGVSNYLRTTAGQHTFKVEATATPGATQLTLVSTLGTATDTSIALTGPDGALGAAVLNDVNLPPPASNAGVRFVNVSADVASFDVFINFSKQVSALGSNTASDYISLLATASTGTAYEFDFNQAGSTTSLLKMTNVLLTSGHNYTIYVSGHGTSLKGTVSQDT